MQANVIKSAVMCIGEKKVDDVFKWGDRKIPFEDAYKYLGLTSTYDMQWKKQMEKP